MRRYSHAAGALLGVLLTALAATLIAVGTEELPRVVSVWPLLAAVGTSVVTWGLQGVIATVLARPRLKNLRVGDLFRVYMAGMFVALISPIRGAELPYKVHLLKRLGLSAGEGSTVVFTRVLLDVAVLTPAALVGLTLYSKLPKGQDSNLLSTGLATAVTLAAVVFLVRRRRQGTRTRRPSGSSWHAQGRMKISDLFADMQSSFASFWRRGHRVTLAYAVALTIVYWACRLCSGPLALMAVGWSGDWIPVIVAQLLLASFVLPLVPTPGGTGARELGLAILLSTYVPERQLLSGIIVYTGLTHWLPVIVGAFFAGRQTWQGIIKTSSAAIMPRARER